MPIRWRLTLWFSLILCGILALSGTVLYLLVQRNLTDQIDYNLKLYSALAHGTINPGEASEPFNYDVIHSSLPPINEFVSPGVYIQLIDRDGNVVVKSDSLGKQELPVNPALIEDGFAGNITIQTLAAGGGAKLRMMVSPLFLQDETLLLEVAQSTSAIDSMLSQIRWGILGGVLVALGLTILLGQGLVQRVLSPVRRITKTAKSIETSPDLSQRVGYQGPMDEIGHLAATFDGMIARLDKAFASQRAFVADASHELRTPLTVIRGNLDLLKRKLSESDRRESLRALELETIRMVKIVNDLLLLAEVDASQLVKREPVKLKEIIAEELARARLLAGDRQLTLEREEDLVVVANTQQIKRLVGNLLDNAIKYTEEDGRITLSLSSEDGWARLEVRDTGVGIAPQDLPYVFDRFYRSDKTRSRSNGGTGLGLAMVKEIAERHGGKVAVTSQPGEGSTFSVWLRI
jgi:two-component system OmpR family sensor kinase